MDTPLDIIKTSRGGDKLCFDGHMYTRKPVKNDWVIWQCYKLRSLSCNEAVTAEKDMTAIRSCRLHNHSADETAVNVAKALFLIKDMATRSFGRPHEILSQVLLESSDAVRTDFGKLDSNKRSIRCTRRGALPKHPEFLSDLIVTDEWNTTRGDNPRSFLIHDSGPESCDRVIVFASQQGL